MPSDWEKTVGEVGENQLIQDCFAPFVAGLGDDVALLNPPEGQTLLVSSDLLFEGVHFKRSWPGDLVGTRAACVNLSDMAASAGCPLWVTLSLALPPDLPLAWLEAFARGFHRALARHGVLWVGGDTTRSTGPISANVTIIGASPQNRSVGRDGASSGDVIFVTGSLGLAHWGFDLLARGAGGALPLDHEAVRHFFDPPFLGDFAMALAREQLVTAMMDLSDGLTTDLSRLCRASSVGASVELARVPVSPYLGEGEAAAKKAVSCGEDFQLLFTVPADLQQNVLALGRRHGLALACLGRITPGCDVVYHGKSGPVQPDEGWQHFGRR